MQFSFNIQPKRLQKLSNTLHHFPTSLHFTIAQDLYSIKCGKTKPRKELEPFIGAIDFGTITKGGVEQDSIVKNVNKISPSIKVERDFMDDLFYKLRLKRLEEWELVRNYKINQNRGKIILSKYQNELQTLLQTLYPNYPWKIHKFSLPPLTTKQNFKNHEKQHEFMSKLFYQFNLTTLDDWIQIPKIKIKNNGGKKLLEYHYSCDLTLLLTSIYPNFPWKFDNLPHRTNSKMLKNFQYRLSKIKSLQNRFQIKEKNDWYRVNSRIDDVNVFKSLKLIYPSEKWDKKKFQFRSKKVNQRLLFLQVQNLYPAFRFFENYRHPLFSSFHPHFFNDNLRLNQNLNNEKENSSNNKHNNNNNNNNNNNDNNINIVHQLNSPKKEEINNHINSKNIQSHEKVLEFDIYSAEINVAIEYQGEHHYDEIPSAFSHINFYQSHDLIKQNFSQYYNIKLISVPYWWDHSSHNLSTSISQTFSSFA